MAMLVTGPVNDGSDFTTTKTVFDTVENPRGSWRTITITHKRNIQCQYCENRMAFIEWETNFWRCPSCHMEN